MGLSSSEPQPQKELGPRRLEDFGVAAMDGEYAVLAHLGVRISGPRSRDSQEGDRRGRVNGLVASSDSDMRCSKGEEIKG